MRRWILADADSDSDAAAADDASARFALVLSKALGLSRLSTAHTDTGTHAL